MSGDLSQYGTQVKQIKSQCPCSLILSLIPDGHKNGISDILEQGVDGCVPRSIMRVCLVKAVELTCRAGVFCLPGNCRDLVSNAGAIQPGSLDLCKLQLSGGTDSLTRREKEILQLMAKNLSNRDIAGKLFISEPTVKTHVSSILRKLGQKNRSQAIVYAYKTGMLNDPP
ncbi:MAG TPA: hypothetical protein DEF34_10650 [Desulfotomaculum sp.]|nr:hypothetical protein [Desulfotomaculum sp.]